ncbi:SpoIID/LytB domain-containing protein, partial [Patescibacteria group bacterium]
IVRRSEHTGEFWAINQLYMEHYLRGIAEQSNGTHKTHLKTMTTIARTYAQWHFEHGGKHPENYFHLNNTSGDQVYKGYNFEVRGPNIRQAVERTQGKMVVKNGEIAITPYFSSSDGRTRSWSEVWHGSFDHLITRPDPWCKGRSLNGHGVGLSAYGALMQAYEGKGYINILKYYYTGVNIRDYY